MSANIGRLKHHEQGDADEYCLLTDDGGRWVIGFRINGEFHTPTQRDIVRRLVACWNACEEYPTKTLELLNGAIARSGISLWLSYTEKKQEVGALTEQRDALAAQLDVVANALLLSAKPGDLLIVKADGIKEEDATKISTSLRRALPVISGVIVIPEDGDVLTTPETAMRAAGWVRTSMIFGLEEQLTLARSEARAFETILRDATDDRDAIDQQRDEISCLLDSAGIPAGAITWRVREYRMEGERQRDALQTDLTAARDALLREGMQRDALLKALKFVHKQMQEGAWLGSEADNIVFAAIASVEGTDSAPPVDNDWIYENSRLKDIAERIAESAYPEDPRLEVAYAIARYLKLDGWPAAYEGRVLDETGGAA